MSNQSEANITPIQKQDANGKQLFHSALFNYTPLVIGGIDKYLQLTIVKPTQTGINRNK
jgi:hypothetical protein